ncbi:NUDIX hydrolase [Ornithinimicrobium sp. Arc0846-15]|nr:NUDIX hydrolase [Ornithinimicrobium laminariae]
MRLARLADDPAPKTREGFLSMLNATLPTKRVIAQGLITNGQGKFLMCQLTYKTGWDLPGGVVDRLESPASAVVREVREELAVQVRNEGLITVDWLPPYRQWDDALLCLYSLGQHPDILEEAVFETAEIVAAHWCDLEMAREHAAPYVVRLLEQATGQDPIPDYLEDGVPPDLV